MGGRPTLMPAPLAYGSGVDPKSERNRRRKRKPTETGLKSGSGMTKAPPGTKKEDPTAG
jgi:hypothetical protein